MRIQLSDAEQADGRMHEANLVLAIRLLREVGAVILEKAVPLEIVEAAQIAYFDAIRRGITRFLNNFFKENRMSSTNLKTTFNTASTLYEDIRPGYPEKLISDIVDLAGIENHSRILEVGCGTGKATRSFAERGYELVCLDIGGDLIVVAREKLKGFPNVSFVEQAFEAWKSEDKFNLVISATAFHWVDPNVRYLKAFEVLKSKGFLAVFSNQHIRKDEGFFAESQSLYDKYYPPLTTNRPTHATNFPGVETFRSPIRRVYPWTQTYSSKQYIKLLNTYSDHIALPDENKRLLFEGIVNLIETKYNGRLTKHYEAVLDLRGRHNENYKD